MEGEESCFVCAFHSPFDALLYSLDLQSSLLRVDWSTEILNDPMASEQLTADGCLLFRGLRVSIGMCTGAAARRQFSSRTGRLEFFGPVMNHAARVAAAGHGGQVRLACDDGPHPGLALGNRMEHRHMGR